MMDLCYAVVDASHTRVRRELQPGLCASIKHLLVIGISRDVCIQAWDFCVCSRNLVLMDTVVRSGLSW